MAFVYSEENLCFSMELNDILFSCETPNQLFESVAKRLAKEYKEKLPLIADYIIKNSEFIKTYGIISKEIFLVMLEKMTIPWIFLKENNSGTIAYSDSDYVIELSFTGDFEKFGDFSIDS